MRYFIILIFLILFSGCINEKNVYWCGDHPCINKKEKQAYFEKTMIVEVKNIKEFKKNKSEMEKITNKAKENEKKRIKSKKEIV